MLQCRSETLWGKIHKVDQHRNFRWNIHKVTKQHQSMQWLDTKRFLNLAKSTKACIVNIHRNWKCTETFSEISTKSTDSIKICIENIHKIRKQHKRMYSVWLEQNLSPRSTTESPRADGASLWEQASEAFQPNGDSAHPRSQCDDWSIMWGSNFGPTSAAESTLPDCTSRWWSVAEVTQPNHIARTSLPHTSETRATILTCARHV